ncbi:IS6 family transposase [Candidatus Odyssella thessalonicensis]|uniref:IS6 family transposase n=1 Tax=Candidatus Odyssella thessalonicensis TaxID=84647 RepID=UPI000225B763|nr:IS6 family transposase [Candidatus Odyssella thessalonicensis]
MKSDFWKRRFSGLIILQCMRWYLRYPLSYRNLKEMMEERGVDVDHTTIYRWVQRYAPEFEKRLRWYAKPLGFSWKVDETYIKIKGHWKYLYRAITSSGETIDFMLSHKRDTKSAIKFFKRALKQCHEHPCKINTDQNPAYAKAIEKIKKEGSLSQDVSHTQVKYSNNRIESDHSRLKRRLRPMLSFQSFHTANRTIKGIEAMLMLVKKQTCFLRRTLSDQIKLINELFHIYS